MSHPPGWYPSPHVPGLLQWWNGSEFVPEVRYADHIALTSQMTEAEVENAKLAPGESRIARKRQYTKRSSMFILAGMILLGLSGVFAQPVFSGDYEVTSGTVSSINEGTYMSKGVLRSSCNYGVTFTLDGNTYTAMDTSSAAGSCLIKIGDTSEVRYNKNDIAGTMTATSDDTLHLRVWGTLATSLLSFTAGALALRSGAPIIVTRRMDGTITTENPKKIRS